MLKETITYIDYNGIERTEDFYFNLNRVEVIEMEHSINGGLSEMIKKIIDAKDNPALINLFKDLVLKSYGEKSLDGKYFLKEDDEGRKLSNKFKQTEAYVQLYTKLASDAEYGSHFVNSIIPKADKNDDKKEQN